MFSCPTWGLRGLLPLRCAVRYAARSHEQATGRRLCHAAECIVQIRVVRFLHSISDTLHDIMQQNQGLVCCAACAVSQSVTISLDEVACSLPSHAPWAP